MLKTASRCTNPAFAAPALALAIGLFLVLEPLFLSGFREMPGEPRDARLVHFVIEHAHRFLLQQDPHRRFWDPPIFYPTRNVAAYTDTMASFVPFYSPWRLLGFAPDTAFQIWHLIVWSLNFLSFHLFLRRVFRLSPVASAAGGFLFAFGSSQALNVVHPQLVPQFYTVITLWALFRIFAPSEADGKGRNRLRLWIAVFFLSLVLQAYGAIYPLFFTVLLLGLAFLGALVMRRPRRELGRLLKRATPTLVVAALLSAAAVTPLARHYYQASQTVQPRTWSTAIEPSIPRLRSWFLMGPNNLLYGWIYQTKLGIAEGVPLRRLPHCNGLGVVTLIFVLTGLYSYRRQLSIRLMVLTYGIAMLMTTVFPGGFTFWHYIFNLSSSLGAIRAVGRIGLFLLFPAGLGLAFYFERHMRRKRVWILILAALLVVIEQRQLPRSYDKLEARRWVASIAGKIEPHCQSFFVSTFGGRPDPAIHEDAMWAASLTGVPTINGRSGNAPPGWHPLRIHRSSRHNQKRLETIRQDLRRWTEQSGLDPKGVCWIEVESLRAYR